MASLSDLLAFIDSRKRVVGRNLSDLVSNPRDYLQKVVERSPETIKDYMSDPMNFVGGGIAGTFIGKSAKTWDKAAHSKALDMEKAGADPRVIWSETGNWKGPDGNWRQEISDDVASFTKSGAKELKDYGARTEGRIFNHSDLYKSYPDTSNIVVLRDKGNDYSGYHTAQDNNIGLSFPNKKIDVNALKDINIHELQHAIQSSEGWAKGGSPEGMREEALGMLRRDVASGAIPTTEQAMAMLPMAQENAYRRLAGEAEARATQKRIPLTAAQRRARFPEEDYDVSLQDLIVRY